MNSDKDLSNTFPNVAVLIPCLNEELTVADVVKDFRAALPDSNVYVYDNDSNDGTVERALEAGAIVRHELHRGKGTVVRRMFSEIQADVYVIVDGDNTYDSSAAPLMVKQLIQEELDMVVAIRSDSTNRFGHDFGNRSFTRLYNWLFKSNSQDLLSGYRAFSRRYVKSFPSISKGFEIETEMSVHASQLQLSTTEIKTQYRSRPEGSRSKLNTYVDGWKILRSMITLVKNNRPLFFFSSFSFVLGSVSLILGVPIILDFVSNGLVERLPTALLATGLAVASLLFVALGLILDMVAKTKIELKRLFYLQNSQL
ncbi:MAG: glycosyltransferase [Euryarchaeota archaeon]|nr:glycosyltransferase [Euryarchaeota archaeon]